VRKTAQLLAAVLLRNLQKKAQELPMGGMGFMTNQLATQTDATNGTSILGNVTKTPTQVQIPNGELGNLAMNPPQTTTDSLRKAYNSNKPAAPTPNPYG